MAFSLDPAFVRINYHSAYAPHSMTIPTTEYDRVGGGFGSGSFQSWTGSDREAADMVADLITALAPWFPASVEFDDYIIFTQDGPTAEPEPQYSASLTQIGTNATPGWSKATERILTFRTASFNVAKLALLDAASGDSFDLATDVLADANLAALVAQFTGNANGWSGRDNTQPTQFIQMTINLNQRSRRAYRMQ